MADEEPEKFSWYRRNLSEIPCFKQSFTNGILSGFGVGLGHFMLTSRVKRSTDLGMFTFTVVTLCYWFYCRYTFSRDRFYYSQIKNAVQKSLLLEGTNKDPKTKED